jgi:hypothetical protein
MNDDNSDWREAWVLFPGEVAYVWHAGNKAHLVAESLLSCAWRSARKLFGLSINS